jgi:phosphoglycolate phosphatase-like HAD superfamily hydrolase
MEMFRHFGVKEIPLEEFRSEWKMPYMDFMWQYIPRKFTQKEQEKFFTEIIFKHEKNQKFPGIENSIKKFKEAGVKMFVISCDLKETLYPQVKSFGLEGIFTEIICDIYDKTEAAKTLIKEYHLNPDQTIFLGDSNHEINVAEAVGIKGGAVTWGFSTEANLAKHHPDFMIHNLAELEKIIGI